MLSYIAIHKLLIILSHLVHMASSNNADACYSLNGKLPDDPRWGWWEWGNNHIYHRCQQLARYDWSTILCGGRAYLPDFCTAAQIFFKFSFFLVRRFPPFSMEESLEIVPRPNHHTNNCRQRKSITAHIYSSSSQSQISVGNRETYQLLIPLAQGIKFDMNKM